MNGQHPEGFGVIVTATCDDMIVLYMATSGLIAAPAAAASDRHPFLGSFLSESFSPNFRHLFRAIFQSSIFSCFLSKYWNVNELDIFCSGEFHE